VQRRVDALHHEAEQSAERYNEARERMSDVRRRLAAVRNRLERQQAAVAELQASIGSLAAASYKAGGLDPVMQLVLSEDPAEFLAQASALGQLSRRQSEALTGVTAARQRLARDRLAVAHQKARATDLRDRLATEKRAVEGKLSEARALLDTLKAEQRRRLEAAGRAAAVRADAVRTTYSRASRSGPRGTVPTYDGPASGRAAVAVRTAYAQLGDPYAYGASGPGAFDCSGLTMYVWRAAGVSLPHSSSMQYSSGRKVSRSALQPGDLVFYYSPISHVGIYVGGGKIIHASQPGTPVQVVGLGTMPYSGAVRP